MPNLETNRYGAICTEIYDIDKPFHHLPDTAFYLDALADVRGPILEPACGTGRAMIPLLQAGHEMAGFDPSEDMLDICRKRCAEHGFSPELKIARYENFVFERAFEAIIIPVGSFTLIGEFAAAIAALKRFHAHLAPGGRLIIDQQALRTLEQNLNDIRQWDAPNGDLLTLHGIRRQTDWLAQRVDYTLRYERWRDGKLIASELEPMEQRFWGVQEFDLALRQCGFGDIRITGDYARGRPPRSSDRTFTFEAVKL